MKNLENNKIYKIGQLALLSISVLSLLLMLIRIFTQVWATKVSFISPYLVWRFFDVGLDSYIANPTVSILFRLIISCSILLGIYLLCLLLSKKSIYFMLGALVYFTLDTFLFVREIFYQNWTKMLVVGLLFKLFIIFIMSVSIFYGFIGKRIEDDDSGEVPDVKYISKKFSNDLTNKKRTISIGRDKSFINSYVYIQLILDGKTVCYLKNGDVYEMELDANQHVLMLV